MKQTNQKPNPNFIPPASVKQGAHTPEFCSFIPPPPPKPSPITIECAYTKIINNPFYKNHIEIKQSKNGMWDVFINGTWACSRNAWENIIHELFTIMKEMDKR